MLQRVLGLHGSWTAAINYASTVHDPCCTGMSLNANYQLNAAADAVIIVYELAKRAGNPPRRVRPRRTCSAGSHELQATVWRRSVPTTRGGESQGSEHMEVTTASGRNAVSISLAQVEADFDPHVAARAQRAFRGGNQQSGPTTSDMPEPFTDPSGDGMEWLCKPAASEDNVCGWFTGTQSGPSKVLTRLWLTHRAARDAESKYRASVS